MNEKKRRGGLGPVVDLVWRFGLMSAPTAEVEESSRFFFSFLFLFFLHTQSWTKTQDGAKNDLVFSVKRTSKYFLEEHYIKIRFF